MRLGSMGGAPQHHEPPRPQPEGLQRLGPQQAAAQRQDGKPPQQQAQPQPQQPQPRVRRAPGRSKSLSAAQLVAKVSSKLLLPHMPAPVKEADGGEQPASGRLPDFMGEPPGVWDWGGPRLALLA